MRTKLGYGFALALVLSIVGVGAGCGGTQGETIVGDDGGTINPGNTLHADGAVSAETGTGITVTGDTGTGTSVPDTGSSSVPDSGGTTTGSEGGVTTGNDSGGGGACPSSCTTDNDCQSMCPATAGAINCCDTVTSACFTSASTSCPDQGSTGGVDSGGGGGY